MNGSTVQCARLKPEQSRWPVGPSMPRIQLGRYGVPSRLFSIMLAMVANGGIRDCFVACSQFLANSE